jgi:hypothetical protein
MSAKILAPSDTVYHPYVYSRHGRSREWHNVCLGDMSGDIIKALVNFDIIAASTLLMQWTSQYTLNRTHPHNKPQTTYYGLPKYIKDQENSEAYLAAFPHNTTTCGVRTAIERIEEDENREIAIIMDNTCNSIDCQLKDNCHYWNRVVNASDERIDNVRYLVGDENYGMYNSLFGWMNHTDQSVKDAVNETMNRLCEHDRYRDHCDDCLDAEAEAYRAIEDENMSDEERTLNWVQRTIERNR